MSSACGDVLLRFSVQSVPLFQPPVGDQWVGFAGGPPVQTPSIVISARNVSDRDRDHGRIGKDLF